MIQLPYSINTENGVPLYTVGLSIELTITESGSPFDISNATTKSIIFQKPDKSVVTKTADFVSDGSDGKIKYVTSGSSDLDQWGTWLAQAYVSIPYFSSYSTINTFYVDRNLD
jgi:hypothetical protein